METIPMSKIRDEVRQIAVLWHESATNWIGDKHKLASDIQNYANKYACEQNVDLYEALEELYNAIDSCVDLTPNIIM